MPLPCTPPGRWFMHALWPVLLFLLIVGPIVYFVVRYRDRVAILGEFWEFLRHRKLWWMTPIAVVMILLAVFVAATSGGSIFAVLYAGIFGAG